MKTDLKDMTFIIPIRIDSIIRLENLILTIECIQKDFDTHIIVLEAANYNNGMVQAMIKDITYYFIEDKDPIYYKTKYLNQMTKEVKTEFIAIWDADVIIDSKQIEDSVNQLRQETCDIAYPYNGEFLDTSDILRNYYFTYRDIEFLKMHKGKMNLLYSAEGVIGAVGGAVFAKTVKYVKAGMDNEKFYGWGLEDGERHYRWLEFGYKIYRNKDCMFHLSHPRDENGMFRSENYQHKATCTFNEIVNYGKDELSNEFSNRESE